MRLNDTVKCAIVLRYAPPKVREYLRMIPTELGDSYERLKSVLHSFRTRGQTFDSTGQVQPPEPLTIATPMEVDMMKGQKGGKGNGKGKGQGKGRGGKGSGKGKGRGPCHTCGRMGHLAGECWQTPGQQSGKGLGKGQLSAGGKGAGKGKQSTWQTSSGKANGKGGRVCFKCGQPGHVANQCRRVNEIADGEVDWPLVQPTGVEYPPSVVRGSANVVDNDAWLLPITEIVSELPEAMVIEGCGDSVLLLVDSGAFAHVCPRNFAPNSPLLASSMPHVVATAADGKALVHHGEKKVPVSMWGTRPALITFQVLLSSVMCLQRSYTQRFLTMILCLCYVL
jgi:hypothetical protein